MTSALMFRNVEGSPSDPIFTWHPEVFTAILSYGMIQDYDPVADEIRSHPWGEVARTVEDILGYTDPEDDEEHMETGTHALFTAIIQNARRDSEERERAEVAAEIRQLVRASGLTTEQFACRCGTSRSRLSSYVSGAVVPRATFMVRARRVADP